MLLRDEGILGECENCEKKALLDDDMLCEVCAPIIAHLQYADYDEDRADELAKEALYAEQDCV